MQWVKGNVLEERIVEETLVAVPVTGCRSNLDVAVDVHQERYAVLAHDRDGNEIWRRRFPATPAGEELLRQKLQPGDRVILEATRGSHRLANFLAESGAEVIVVDAAQARLIGRCGKKTDFRDAAALLKHLRGGDYAEVWRADDLTRQLRYLTAERLASNKIITQLKNRIRALLHELGISSPGDKLWGPEGVAWLAAQKIEPITQGILLRSWQALQSQQELKDQAEREALGTVATERMEVPRLMQIAGFGMVSAVLFLGQVGDLSRFRSAKHLTSYAGLNPRVKQSDRYTQTGSISKAGRSPLRWLMVEVAWGHVKATGPQAGHYHRLVSSGKPSGVAIVALARKLLSLAYHLLRDEAAYRDLHAEKYERKLRELGAFRAATAEPQETHRDWAAAVFTRVTGAVSPYRKDNPEPRPTRMRRARRSVRQPAEVAR